MMDHKIMVQMKIEEKANEKEDNGGKKQTKYGTRKKTT